MSILAVMGIATDVVSLFPLRDRELSCDYNPTGGHIARLDCTAGSSPRPNPLHVGEGVKSKSRHDAPSYSSGNRYIMHATRT